MSSTIRFILLISSLIISFLHQSSLLSSSAQPISRPPARPKSSVGVDTYYGNWRHVALPRGIHLPTIRDANHHEGQQVIENTNDVEEGNNIESQQQLRLSSSSSSSFVLMTPEQKQEMILEKNKKIQEQSHFLRDKGSEFPTTVSESFALDFEVTDLQQLLDISAKARLQLKLKQFVPSGLGDADEEKINNNVNNNLGCSARFITRNSSTSSGKKTFPSALEVSCNNLDTTLRQAGSYFKKQEILRQQHLRALIEAASNATSKLPNNKNNKNKKSSSSKPANKKKIKDEEFDPSIPSFRFLNYDEPSVFWPMARVSAVLYSSSSSNNNQQILRHFEGSNTGCIESLPALAAQHENEQRHSIDENNNNNATSAPINSLSRIAVLIPLERSAFSMRKSPATSIQELLSSNNNNNKVILSIRIRMLPLGNRNPISRQLVRWLKYVPPTEDLLSAQQKLTQSKDDNDDSLFDFEKEKREAELINNDTNVMFELRATEKRLTRVGGGFKARLRRNDSRLAMPEHEKKKYHRQIRHLPIYSNWSIEVFRRVPRPSVECVAVFSRLLDFPEMFHPNTVNAAKNLAATADQEEEAEGGGEQMKNQQQQKQKPKLVDESDGFDDDDDEEEDQNLGKLSEEEMKLKRKRERIRTLLAKKEHNAAVPNQERIANAKMHLVAAHQLRGVLDSNFALPEFSRLSPVISIPAGPAPALMENEADIVASRKRPPTGLFVLYVSQERAREQVVDVEIKQADYHFVAPLKLEKKVLNITFAGDYERLPIPRPPVTNWTWFDTNDVALVAPPQVSQHKKLDPRLAAQVNSPEAIHEQQMLDSRGTLPRLTFQYRDSHNNTRLPGFAILVEQNRPIDDLQVWIFDGKNDTLFLDEENFVPFTVPSHSHDPLDSPLFGWRLALDSQRLIALDTMYISFAFNYRKTNNNNKGEENDDDDDDDFVLLPSTADYLSAISLFNPGQEAAKHLLSWVDAHRWIPLAGKRNNNNIRNLDTSQSPTDVIINAEEPQGLPHFASFVDYQRNYLSTSKNRNNNRKTKPISNFVSLEQDSKTAGMWRLFANRDLPHQQQQQGTDNNDLFTLPWSAIIRHTQAPHWIIEMVTSSEFENSILRKHEQVLLSSDHVDLPESTSESTESSSSSSSSIKRIREILKKRRQTAFDNIRAWCALTLMHWAQVEPELANSPPLKWGSEAIATRFHSHYRMFNERIRTDAARKLRNYVVSRHKNAATSPQEERSHLPSPAWCPLAEILSQRAAFLEETAKFFMSVHPGLPKKFSGGELSAVDWFSSAFTIIEARSLLITLNTNKNKNNNGANSEWIYIPLLDYATPGISPSEEFEQKKNQKNQNNKFDETEKANIDLVVARATVATSHIALRVVTLKPISKGTPLIFGGWSGRGFRTVIDGLVLFGFLNQNMGFAEAMSPLLPFGPVLHHNDKEDSELLKHARDELLDECRARCSRVADGRTISMKQNYHPDDDENKSLLLLKERSESFENIKNNNTCCCNLQWLDAKLRRKWKQVTANDLLWSVPREALKKMMWAVSKFPRDSDEKTTNQQQNKNFVSILPETEPPMWKASKQYLVSSTRKVLETHIAEIAKEMEEAKIERNPALASMPRNLSGLNVKELISAVFGDEINKNNDDGSDEEKSSSSLTRLKVDSPIESYIDESDNTIYLDDEAKWFGCCKKNGGNDDEEQEIPRV